MVVLYRKGMPKDLKPKTVRLKRGDIRVRTRGDLTSCGGKKISHRDFRLTIIREMLAWSGHEPRPSMPVGRPTPASTNIGRLDTHHNKHWPGRNPKLRHCRMCSVRCVTQTMLFKCVKCDVALCVDQSCFEDYHTKKPLIRHLFFRSPCKLLEPQPQCK